MDKKLDLSGVRIYTNTKDDILDAMDLIDEEVYMSNSSDFNTYDICNLAGVVGIKHIENDSRHFLAEGDNGLGFREYKYLILAKEMEMIEKRVVKKIDVKNSLMFNNQIDNLKAAIEYLTEEGYFSDHENFPDYKEGTLVSILVADNTPRPYESGHDNQNCYRYFIPKNKVVFIEKSSKKYRPYVNLADVPFTIGDLVIYRHKHCYSECRGMVTEIKYQKHYPYAIDNIIIGSISVTPQELFDNYEWLDSDCQYKPFGIEE